MKKLLFIVATTLFYYSAFKAQTCSELFISKYVSMGSNNKCIEIYNPTANPILLTGKYYIARYKTPTSGGNTSGPVPQPPNYDDTLWLKGTVPSYSTWVICNPEVTTNASNFGALDDPRLRAHANQLGNFYGTYGSSVGDPTYFKGSDAITLEKKNGTVVTIVDIFGRFTDFMAASNGKPSAWSTTAPYTGGTGMGWWITKGYMMVRKNTVITGITANPPAFNPLAEYDTIVKPKTVADTVNTWNLLGHHTCNCAVGIKEYSKQIKVSVYPNPVYGNNSIRIESSQAISSIQIYDIEGGLISTKIISTVDSKVDLSTKELSPGLYVIKIYHENGSLGVARFTKY